MREKTLQDIAQNISTIFPAMGRRIIRPFTSNKDNKVTSVQLQVMILLRAEGHLTMSDIAKSLHISNPNVTTLIDKLIEADLVARVHDANDRRIVRVMLTEQGAEFLHGYDSVLAGMLENLFTSVRDEELEEFSDSLNVVLGMLDRLEA